MRFVGYSFVLVVLCYLEAVPLQAAFTFTPLGDLPGGAFESGARAVSADGSVVVGFGSSMNGYEPFRWTLDSGIVGLGDVGNVFDSGRGISGDGSVVAGIRLNNGHSEAFRWTQAEGIIGLGVDSLAFGISADGRVIVGMRAFPNLDNEAFRWTAENGIVGLGDLPGGRFRSEARGVSADGSVVVGKGSPETASNQAFRWTADSGMAGVDNSLWANAVSADGSVVVGVYGSANGAEAFRRTPEGGLMGLGDLSGGLFNSEAFGVSDDGSVVIGEGITAAGTEAFLWTQELGIVDLRRLLISNGVRGLESWRLSARGISADGTTIVGSGVQNGVTQAWVATIPEPSTEVLTIFVFVGSALTWCALRTMRSWRRRIMRPRPVS